MALTLKLNSFFTHAHIHLTTHLKMFNVGSYSRLKSDILFENTDEGTVKISINICENQCKKINIFSYINASSNLKNILVYKVFQYKERF